MKFSNGLLLVALLAGTGCAGKQADPSPQIKAFYSDDDALFQKMDAAGAIKLVTDNFEPDYVSYSKPDASGKRTKRTLAVEIASIKQIMNLTESIPKSESRVESLEVTGDTAVAKVTSTIEMKTKPGPGGRPSHTLTAFSKSEDTWIKVGASWKLKSAKILESTMAIDGKPK